MKAEELMIGDWAYIHHPSQERNARRISADDLVLKSKIELGFVNQEQPIFRIFDPIPLTPEILEKNGFQNISERIDRDCDSFSSLFELNEDAVLGKLDDSYYVCHEKWNGDWDAYDHTSCFSIKHLHELQHTLKLLKIEKEIVL